MANTESGPACKSSAGSSVTKCPDCAHDPSHDWKQTRLALLLIAVLSFGLWFTCNDRSDHATDTSDDASDTHSILGEKAIQGKGRIGCVSRADYDKLTSYVAAGDREGFSRLLELGLATGTCVAFKEGETVYVLDVAVLSAAVKVRRQGELNEYWTAIEAVRGS
jgi:hypothetical protein